MGRGSGLTRATAFLVAARAVLHFVVRVGDLLVFVLLGRFLLDVNVEFFCGGVGQEYFIVLKDVEHCELGVRFSFYLLCAGSGYYVNFLGLHSRVGCFPGHEIL